MTYCKQCGALTIDAQTVLGKMLKLDATPTQTGKRYDARPVKGTPTIASEVVASLGHGEHGCKAARASEPPRQMKIGESK